MNGGTMEQVEYEGFIIVFKENKDVVEAGFPKNFPMVSGKTKDEAIGKMKKIVDDFPDALKNAYKKHGKTMRELEDL